MTKTLHKAKLHSKQIINTMITSIRIQDNIGKNIFVDNIARCCYKEKENAMSRTFAEEFSNFSNIVLIE